MGLEWNRKNMWARERGKSHIKVAGYLTDEFSTGSRNFLTTFGMGVAADAEQRYFRIGDTYFYREYVVRSREYE